MVSDPVMYYPDSCRKICRAGVAVWVKEKKRLVHALQPAAVQSPVHNVVMLLGGCHVVDILSVIPAADGLPHAYELPCMYGSHKFDESSIKMELFLITQTEEK